MTLEPAANALLVALGCGLLIGIERERRKGKGAARGFAGMRSFALASVLGAMGQLLGPMLVGVGAVLVLLLCAMSYWRDQSGDPGITTELALFLSYLLGVNAVASPAVSAAAAVIVAALLALRTPLHHFARVSLKAGEMRDGLVLAGAALVAWPLLPDAATPWLLGANPKRLWGLAVLVMAVQSLAHVALRIAGPKLGLALSGLASGFVSSVATTASMGAHCKREPALADACLTGALLSNIATFVFMFGVTMAVAPALVGYFAPVLAVGLLAAAAGAGLSFARQRSRPDYLPSTAHAFDLRSAILFALLLGGAAAAVSWANARLGPGAAQAGAALAGAFDVHAASGSVLSLASGGAISPHHALRAVLAAVSTNAASKCGAALAGGRAFALRVALAQVLIVAALWTAYAFLG
jgi:uncharacterized membrane protein (DUF4010 family)